MTDIFKTFNFEVALERILIDTLSDFVFIPQFSDIYQHATKSLISLTKKKLSDLVSDLYTPQPPIIIEVAKPNGLTRPGASLFPIDRLIYQCLADKLVNFIEKEIDRSIVFSHQLSKDRDHNGMFLPPGKCYKDLKDELRNLLDDSEYNYVLRSDVHSYFENINLHDYQSLLNES